MVPPLSTHRLTLRQFQTSDAYEIFKLNEDPDVIRYTGDESFSAIEEAEKFIASYDQYQRYNCGRLAVILKETNEFLGWCGLKYMEEEKETDLGFRFHKKFWNKGYATEASIACLNYGFNTLCLEEIIAHAMNDNKASIKVLEKLGMKYLRDFDFKGNKGVYMQLLKKDFMLWQHPSASLA